MGVGSGMGGNHADAREHSPVERQALAANAMMRRRVGVWCDATTYGARHWAHSGRTPGALRAHSGRTPGALRAHSGRTPGALRAHSGRTPGALRAHSGRTLGALWAHSGRTPG